ncbi:MAG: aminopeptidase, partial [Deltaproteobacteria bacterium]|nr:aminopeptidase [Deltaproteobacteria bacterium]
KGYFEKPPADAEAVELEGQGYDTLVRPSAAFSTLGWFDDPLLSTMLRYDEVTLAEVVIHELLHNTTYVAGHADFDESFANFVGNRGAIEFFASRNDVGSVERGTLAWNDTLAFSEFLSRNVERLRFEYDRGLTLDKRNRLFKEMQSELHGLALHTDIYRTFATRPLNNAIILHYLVYSDRLRLFEDIWQQRSQDLALTIQAVRAVADAHCDDPFAAVQSLRANAAATTATR